MRSVALVAMSLLVLLAGCSDGDERRRDEVVFEPDLAALKQAACNDGEVTLPAPLFGALVFTGQLDEPGGSEACAEVAAGRGEQTSVTLNVVAVRGPDGVGLDAQADGGQFLLLGQGAVYGIVGLQAPAGPWGEAGAYELDYDAVGDAEATLAWIRCTPDGCRSTSTI